jgi:hypothetical protein
MTNAAPRNRPTGLVTVAGKACTSSAILLARPARAALVLAGAIGRRTVERQRVRVAPGLVLQWQTSTVAGGIAQDGARSASRVRSAIVGYPSTAISRSASASSHRRT